MLDYRIDDSAADTSVRVVANRILPGRNGPLRFIERNVCRAVGLYFDPGGLVGLAVAHLHLRAKCSRWRRLGQPMQAPGRKLSAEEQRMLAALNDDEHVARRVLGGDEP